MSELDLNKVRKYFTTQPINKAWLFGSYARGEATIESDVDILVSFNEDEKIGLKFISIINDLEDQLNKNVDLVEETTLLPWIKPFVDKEKILIYERKT